MGGKGYEEKCGGKIGQEMWKESRENVEGVKLEKHCWGLEKMRPKSACWRVKSMWVHRAKNWVVKSDKNVCCLKIRGGGKLSENVRGSQKNLIFEWGSQKQYCGWGLEKSNIVGEFPYPTDLFLME